MKQGFDFTFNLNVTAVFRRNKMQFYLQTQLEEMIKREGEKKNNTLCN